MVAGALGMSLPAFQQARLEPGECTDVHPTEYRADAVVVLTEGEAPVPAVVVEVQLGRDGDKRWSWPVYVATLRARLRCPTVLPVVCVDAATAAWCAAAPIELGPGARWSPVVLGPDRVPFVTDLDDAGRAPELSVLSAMAHRAHPDRNKALDALPGAFAAVDEERAPRHHDLVVAALPEAARRYLEALMATGTRYEYQSDFARRHRSQGRAEGKAAAVLAFLDARGVEVPTDARTRVSDCSDLDQLDTWVRRAATVDSIHDLFEQGGIA